MSQKRECPTCKSYTSAIHRAWLDGEPCPYCAPVSADETTAATPLDLDAIEARAQAAGGREWFLAYGANGYPQRVLELGTVILRAECFEGPAFPASTAEHIAGMNPATTLALVAEVRRLREREQQLVAELDDTAAELIGMGE